MDTITDRAAYCISVVMALEGGYVNDPHDPGGETKFGISKASYPNVDIANLTPAQAQFYYQRDYWNAINGDKLPTPLDLYVFDAAVNQGVAKAVMMLQKIAGVSQDGRLGPQTIAAATGVQAKRYLAERAYHYAQNSNWSFYYGGWMDRLFTLCTR